MPHKFPPQWVEENNNRKHNQWLWLYINGNFHLKSDDNFYGKRVIDAERESQVELFVG